MSLPEIPLKTIFDSLEETPAGQSLKQMVRYNGFRDETESPTYWMEVLGPSAIDFYHMQLVYEVTVDLVV